MRLIAGVGYTSYGDHAARICGLEVVLPDGDLVRTGMGAMTGSKTWNLYRNGFGPGWDTMFCQSNLGIVTKLGLWLMPEPEAVAGYDYEFDKPDDLGWAIDTIMPLRRDGLIQQSPKHRQLAAFCGGDDHARAMDQRQRPAGRTTWCRRSATSSRSAGGACKCASMAISMSSKRR